MAGRRPKPTHLKVLQKNPGKRKLNTKEPKPRKAIPDPSDRLTDRARDIYMLAGEHTLRMGVLTDVDGLALELLATAADEYFSAQEILKGIAETRTLEVLGESPRLKDGMVYESETQNGKIIRAHPANGIASDAWKRAKSMLVEFGLTPSSRSRLQGPSEDENDEHDEFARLLG